MTHPRHRDIGVIGMMTDTWGGIWQPRHHVMTRLAKHFHVVWVDPLANWRAHWLPKHPAGITGWASGNTPAPPDMPVLRSSRWVPGLHRPQGLATALKHRQVRRAVTLLRARGARRFVVYLWRPEFHYALDAVPDAVSCYHLDDEYTFLYNMDEQDAPVPPREAALLKRVDQVFVHSPGLMEKKGHFNPHTLMVPNGVDFSAYATPRPVPDDLRAVPHPRVGYVGILKNDLNMSLLLSLAEQRQDISWVLVGPVGVLKGPAEQLRDLMLLPNVYALGRRTVDELPSYVQHVDVCLLPYVENDYTRYIYPMKLHEYLATGRPVIGTPIRSLAEFRNVIRLAQSGADWSREIDTALRDAPGSSGAARRRQVAQDHDWNRLVQRIAGALLARLDSRAPAPR